MNIHGVVSVREACIQATLGCVREGRPFSPLFFRRLHSPGR